MQKKIFLIGLLSLTLLTPTSAAYAQGYPTFDVAKLAMMITNLVARFQPVPQVLSRVNQVKKTISQVKAVSSAVTSGDLKSLGQTVGKSLKDKAFSNGRPKSAFARAAEGDNGAQEAADMVKDKLFVRNNNGQVSESDLEKVQKAREEYTKNNVHEASAEVLYHAMNAPGQSKERFDKAKEALQNAGTIQDAMNAYTMAIMAGNFERITQISMETTSLKSLASQGINMVPKGGLKKPEPFVEEMGGATYHVEDKGGPNVDL
ncbi:MAG: hypothetical protein J5787_02305 [Alphaproteobacteria bacterium]|nr:hypothetical protein [Alphaproteobacteria bacterium]